jgi:hypothetical protein
MCSMPCEKPYEVVFYAYLQSYIWRYQVVGHFREVAEKRFNPAQAFGQGDILRPEINFFVSSLPPFISSLSFLRNHSSVVLPFDVPVRHKCRPYPCPRQEYQLFLQNQSISPDLSSDSGFRGYSGSRIGSASTRVRLLTSSYPPAVPPKLE